MKSNKIFKDMKRIIIEITSYCNRKCKYCPNYTIGRKNKLMKEKLFYKIINNLKKYNFEGVISPTGYGEPLTDPRLEKFVKYIKKNLPSSLITISTNGDFLTIKKYLTLKQNGVDYFLISNHVENPTNTASETIKFIKKNYPSLLKVYVKDVKLMIDKRLFHNRGGLVKNIKTKKYSRCPYNATDQMNINVDGDVLFCCHDYLAKHKFGNVFNEDLYKIWNSKKYIRFRNLIENGKLPYKMCKICTGNFKES